MKNLICLIFVFAAPLVITGGGKRNPEQSAVMEIIQAIQIFEGMHEGHSSTNWSELSQIINLEKINGNLKSRGAAYPLETHYVFVHEKLQVPEYEKGKVVLIRTAPLKEDDIEGQGRYIISRYQGALKFNWLPEEKVQQMLAKAGVTELPKPEPWPPTTNNAVHSQSPPRSNSVERDVKPPREQKLPSAFQPPQNTNPTNEIVAVAPLSKEKSWWPVFIILGIGAIIVFAFTRTRKRP